MSVAENVRAAVDSSCVVNRCRKEGCRVPLTGAPRPSVLIDFDNPRAPVPRQGQKCDYLLVADCDENAKAWVVPMELKKGKIGAGEVARQLSAGARVADQLVPAGTTARFVPVAVHGGRITRHVTAGLRKRGNQIAFRQANFKIKLLKCGQPLKNALR